MHVACTQKNEEIITRKKGGKKCHCNQYGYCVDDGVDDGIDRWLCLLMMMMTVDDGGPPVMMMTADDDDDCWRWVLIDGTRLLMMMITVDGAEDDDDGVSTKDEINVPITLSVFRDKEWWC